MASLRTGPTTTPAGSSPGIESVADWLDEHEHEHAGLTPFQEQLEAYLKQKQGSDKADI